MRCSLGIALGTTLTGIQVRDRITKGGKGEEWQVFVVGYHDEQDSMNPRDWSHWTRIAVTINIATFGWTVGFASSIDAAALEQGVKAFGVTEAVETRNGTFLGGALGLSSLDLCRRLWDENPVYIGTLSLYMIFITASG